MAVPSFYFIRKIIENPKQQSNRRFETTETSPGTGEVEGVSLAGYESREVDLGFAG